MIKKYLLIILTIMFISCSGKRLPMEYIDYSGIWEGDGTYLAIYKNGNVTYTTYKDGFSISKSGKLSEIDDKKIIFNVFIFPVELKIEDRPSIIDGEKYFIVNDQKLRFRKEVGESFSEDFNKNFFD